MDRAAIMLWNTYRSQIRWDSAFRTRLNKALEETRRMMCGTQYVSESFVQEFEPNVESVPLPLWFSSQLVWKYAAVKSRSSGQGS
jgi:hypothetical protein